MNIKIKRLSETAILPTFGSENAAGMDLHADLPEIKSIPPGGRAVIPTGITMALPVGRALLICPRSGLSAKSGVTVHNGPGVIDADYRGEIGVILHNTSIHASFVVKPGDRIAQGVMIVLPCVVFEEVETLDETKRGAGGFGSTGIAVARELEVA